MEEPTPEEEEQLDELTPTLRKQLTEYSGYSDEDIREALWYNYLDPEAALKELKSMFWYPPRLSLSHSHLPPISRILTLSLREVQEERGQEGGAKAND